MRNKKMWKKFLSIGICTGMLLQTTTAFAQEQPTEIFVETEATEDVTEVAESEVEVTEGMEEVVESEVGVSKDTTQAWEETSETTLENLQETEKSEETTEETEVLSNEVETSESEDRESVSQVETNSDFVKFPATVECINLWEIFDYKKVELYSNILFDHFREKKKFLEGNESDKCLVTIDFQYPTDRDIGFTEDEYVMTITYEDQGALNENTSFNIPMLSSLGGDILHYHKVLEDGTLQYVGKGVVEYFEVSVAEIDNMGEEYAKVCNFSVKQSESGTYIITKGKNTVVGQGFVIADNKLVQYIGTDSVVVIPNEVKRIGAEAFKGNQSIKEVIIPDSVTEIGEGAFEGCENLEKVTMPKELKTIEGSVFRNCISLKEIKLPEQLETIRYYAFKECQSLQTIQFPSGLKEIWGQAFCNSGLTSIKIPEGVTEINPYTFSGCKNLVEIQLPSTLNSINTGAFWGCTSITKLQLPNSIKYIWYWAFSNCTSLKEVVVFNEYKTYDVMQQNKRNIQVRYTHWEENENGGAASSGSSLPSVENSIGNGAFWGCSSLEYVEFPDNIYYFGEGMFSNCTSLKEIYIPQRITFIANDAFVNSGLTTIYGIANSYAQTFAEANGYSFQVMTQPVVELAEGNTSLQKSEVEALVNANKMSDVTMKSANGVVFVFPRGTMRLIDGKEVYDFGSLIQTTYPEKEEISFAKNEFVARVHYNYSGQLPATAYISIPLGQEYAGQTLYYHKLLEDGTTKYITSAVVDSNGIYTITQDSCSDYIITTVKESVTNSGNDSGVGDTTGNNGSSNGDTTGNGTDNTVGNTTGGNETNSGDNTGNNGSVEDTNSTTGENNNQTEGTGENTSTGDENVVMIYMIGLMVSIVGIFVGMVSKKKYFN